jgi:hypothetical protein
MQEDSGQMLTSPKQKEQITAELRRTYNLGPSNAVLKQTAEIRSRKRQIRSCSYTSENSLPVSFKQRAMRKQGIEDRR